MIDLRFDRLSHVEEAVQHKPYFVRPSRVCGWLSKSHIVWKESLKAGEGELSRWSSSRQMADDKSADIKMRQRLTAEHVSVCIADPVRYLG